MGRIVKIYSNVGFWLNHIPFVCGCYRWCERFYLENNEEKRVIENVDKTDDETSIYHKASRFECESVCTRVVQESFGVIFLNYQFIIYFISTILVWPH